MSCNEWSNSEAGCCGNQSNNSCFRSSSSSFYINILLHFPNPRVQIICNSYVLPCIYDINTSFCVCVWGVWSYYLLFTKQEHFARIMVSEKDYQLAIFQKYIISYDISPSNCHWYIVFCYSIWLPRINCNIHICFGVCEWNAIILLQLIIYSTNLQFQCKSQEYMYRNIVFW